MGCWTAGIEVVPTDQFCLFTPTWLHLKLEAGQCRCSFNLFGTLVNDPQILLVYQSSSARIGEVTFEGPEPPMFPSGKVLHFDSRWPALTLLSSPLHHEPCFLLFHHSQAHLKCFIWSIGIWSRWWDTESYKKRKNWPLSWQGIYADLRLPMD